MKSFVKLLLVGAVAIMAIAASPSEAAKKKMKMAKATGCTDVGLCAAKCGGKTCEVNFCGADKQWHLAVLTPFCLQGQCPPKC